MRYYDEIVWNRAARFDAVFGSSNSSKSLPDWLAEGPALKLAQETRWARLLAKEALEEAAEQQLLARLAVHIAEQRDEIQARNAARLSAAEGAAAPMTERMDRTSQAGSAFDFGDDDDNDHSADEEFVNLKLPEDVSG